jgi:hypothetical protein
VHVSAHGLQQHFVIDEDGDLVELHNDPVVEGQEFCWEAACAFLLHALRALGTLFKKIERSKTDHLAARFDALRAERRRKSQATAVGR